MAMCTLSHLFVAPIVQLTSHLELTSDTRSTDFTFQLDQKSKKLFWFFFILLRLRSVFALSDFKVINSICNSWQLEQLIIDLLVDIFPFKLYQSCCDFQRFIIIERFQLHKKKMCFNNFIISSLVMLWIVCSNRLNTPSCTDLGS